MFAVIDLQIASYVAVALRDTETLCTIMTDPMTIRALNFTGLLRYISVNELTTLRRPNRKYLV